MTLQKLTLLEAAEGGMDFRVRNVPLRAFSRDGAEICDLSFWNFWRLETFQAWLSEYREYVNLCVKESFAYIHIFSTFVVIF